jgi:arginine-tRNA-protein transferase
MQVQLYELNHGACPYLPDRTWVTHSFRADTLPEGVYDHLITVGWRRSGQSFYQNHCPGCSLCIPIRVDPRKFRPSKSQRKSIRRNADVHVRRVPLAYDEEVYRLYARYSIERHGTEVSKRQYVGFLGATSVTTEMMLYYVDTRLVGVGWIDVLHDGLSSVYFAFDPDESDRSLGTYSVVRELQEVQDLNKNWLYLGFYVPESPKMAYKSRFRPHELLIGNKWERGSQELETELSRRAKQPPSGKHPIEDG